MVEARGDQHAFGSVARPGAISRWLRRSYTRLGPRYPRIALLVTLFGSYLTGALATAGTALYIDMSLAEFARLSLASWFLIWTPEVVVAGAIGLTRIKPVSRWLEGTRDEWHTAKGWEAAADLPLALTRSPIVYAAALPGMVLWGLYAVDQLDLPEYSVGIFFAASLLVYLYWAAVRFLALEFNFRPILDDIARTLPTDPHFQPLRVPLRWRLLASLVAVILITGIAVGGFAARGAQDVRGLGFALLGSAVVAVVVSSWLIGLLSTSITRPISRLRDAAREVGRGDLSIRVPVASTDESGELTRAFNQMVDGLEQRERLREAFGTYVDPDLTERVLEEGPDLAGDEVELSLLFMDIRGFTTYSESAAPQEVVARLNDLYGQVVPAILRHGGQANKFIGDGLLAVFGAPNRLEDHADRAVAAGIEIARLVRERFRGDLRVGIGVNSGTVVVGTIGGGGRLDFTVIGDAVNTAARVESATRKTDDDLLITEQSRDLLSDELGGWVEREPVALKGKSQEIRLFASRVLESGLD